MANYTDTTLLQNYLQRDLTADEVATLSIVIPAIDQWINNKLDTRFDEVSSSSKYYDGDTASINIQPCTTITAVENVDYAGTTLFTYTDLDYVAEPYNDVVKREIRARQGEFPCGVANIKVTASFSEYNNGVPDDIATAATRIAASILSSSQNVGNIQSESLEGHSVTYSNESIDKTAMQDPIVISIIDQRKELLV